MFVEEALGTELENPLRKVHAGSVLGRDSFIRAVLDNLKKDVFKSQEISHRKVLQTRYEAKKILQVVSKHFGTRPNELLKRKGDGRDLLIHLLKNKTGMTNREIGDLVGGLSYSGVSRVEERFVEKLKKNRSLNKDLKTVLRNMSNIKG